MRCESKIEKSLDSLQVCAVKMTEYAHQLESPANPRLGQTTGLFVKRGAGRGGRVVQCRAGAKLEQRGVCMFRMLKSINR